MILRSNDPRRTGAGVDYREDRGIDQRLHLANDECNDSGSDKEHAGQDPVLDWRLPEEADT